MIFIAPTKAARRDGAPRSGRARAAIAGGALIVIHSTQMTVKTPVWTAYPAGMGWKLWG